MREIKFRAWVGKMEYDIVLGRFGVFFVNSGAKGDGLDPNDSASLTPFNTKLDGAVLMQYTGLHDKNGKEIYEGDVVRLEAFNPPLAEVVFDRGGFCLRFGSMDGYYPDIKYAEDDGGEVIGSIYEHPELITHKQS